MTLGTRLQGKTAMVTAAAQGIGHATALAMAREGAVVYASDVNPKVMDAFAGQANIHPGVLDVLKAETVTAYVAALPQLDVLFNCAGWVHQGNIFECDDQAWDFSFELNVKAMYRVTKAALPKLIDAKARGGGSIINMSSVVSSIKGLPRRFAYGASKAAVIGLTKSVACDFVKDGVRCNAICPGTVDTPSLGDRINAFADPAQARKDFIARQPMGRLATAEEIAPLVVFLASDESHFVTGNAYAIDGGITI
jgi:2-keto-3-deoxy-L-fuconate dehydrogenase